MHSPKKKRVVSLKDFKKTLEQNLWFRSMTDIANKGGTALSSRIGLSLHPATLLQIPVKNIKKGGSKCPIPLKPNKPTLINLEKSCKLIETSVESLSMKH